MVRKGWELAVLMACDLCFCLTVKLGGFALRKPTLTATGAGTAE